MSLDIVTRPLSAVPQMWLTPHPLAPLTADEINIAATLVHRLWPSGIELQYKTVTLQEPLKAEVLLFLEAEHGRGPLPSIRRKAFVNYYIRNTVCLYWNPVPESMLILLNTESCSRSCCESLEGLCRV